jgi:hypothetical protein
VKIASRRAVLVQIAAAAEAGLNELSGRIVEAEKKLDTEPGAGPGRILRIDPIPTYRCLVQVKKADNADQFTATLLNAYGVPLGQPVAFQGGHTALQAQPDDYFVQVIHNQYALKPANPAKADLYDDVTVEFEKTAQLIARAAPFAPAPPVPVSITAPSWAALEITNLRTGEVVSQGYRRGCGRADYRCRDRLHYRLASYFEGAATMRPQLRKSGFLSHAADVRRRLLPRIQRGVRKQQAQHVSPVAQRYSFLLNVLSQSEIGPGYAVSSVTVQPERSFRWRSRVSGSASTSIAKLLNSSMTRTPSNLRISFASAALLSLRRLRTNLGMSSYLIGIWQTEPLELLTKAPLSTMNFQEPLDCIRACPVPRHLEDRGIP